MKVTSVEPQKNNLPAGRQGPRRFNIFLDNKFAFGADEDTVVNFRLVVGKEINPETLEKIIFQTEVGKLMEKMYRLFGIRMRSEKEVRDYFRIKNQEAKIKGKEEKSEIVIDALILNLQKKGMLNDLEFAKLWVQSRRKSKNKGINALKSELFQKGIDREIIAEVLTSEKSEISELNLAEKALEKKLKSWRSLPQIEFKQKAIQYLLRRGFDYRIAKVSVEKLKIILYDNF